MHGFCSRFFFDIEDARDGNSSQCVVYSKAVSYNMFTQQLDATKDVDEIDAGGAKIKKLSFVFSLYIKPLCRSVSDEI